MPSRGRRRRREQWSSRLPGEEFKTVDTEAMSALRLDRLPEHLETLLALVLILHGHREHAAGDPSEGSGGGVQRDASHASPSTPGDESCRERKGIQIGRASCRERV